MCSITQHSAITSLCNTTSLQTYPTQRIIVGWSTTLTMSKDKHARHQLRRMVDEDHVPDMSPLHRGPPLSGSNASPFGRLDLRSKERLGQLRKPQSADPRHCYTKQEGANSASTSNCPSGPAAPIQLVERIDSNIGQGSDDGNTNAVPPCLHSCYK